MLNDEDEQCFIHKPRKYVNKSDKHSNDAMTFVENVHFLNLLFGHPQRKDNLGHTRIFK